MKLSVLVKKYKKNDAAMIVSAALLMVASLVTFEYVTGLPASLRGDPMYGSLPEPSSLENIHKAGGPEAVSDDALEPVDETFMDRVCDRVVRRFITDETMWERVNERLEKRFGFSCEQ